MNKPRFVLLALIGALILACNLPAVGSTAVSPTDTAVPTAAEAADLSTDTPAPVAPTLTSVPPSPSVPMASPSNQAVNCRSGPALGWDVLTLIQFGQSVEIVGKIADASWVEVKNPGVAGGVCWMSAGVVSITGNLGGVPVVAAPIPPTGLPTSLALDPVKSVSISLSETTISVAGCVGPIQPVTIYATIWVNRAVTLRWHFETQQRGNLQSHALILSKATGKDVSDSFTPKVVKGKYWVKLVIDDVDVSDMDSVVTYKINCP